MAPAQLIVWSSLAPILPCTEGSDTWQGRCVHSPPTGPRGAVSKVFRWLAVLGFIPFPPESVVSPGQVSKLQSTLGTADLMVSRGKQSSLSDKEMGQKSH